MGHAVNVEFYCINTFVAGAVVLAGAFLAPRASAVTEHAAARDKPTVPAHNERRLGVASQWVVSLDGLLTVSYAPPHEESSFVDDMGNRHTTTFESLSTVLFAPRLSVDAFVADHLSLGLGATYSQNDLFTTTSNDGSAVQHSAWQQVTMNPRVGLAYGGASGVGIWGRAGVLFGAMWQSNNFPGGSQDIGSYSLAASVDLVATYRARKELLLMVGPWVREGIMSWSDSSSVENTTAPPNFGVTIGAGLVL